MTLKTLRKIQVEISKKVIEKDDFINEIVGGASNSFLNNKIISCVVVYHKKIIEKKHVIMPIPFKYIPGFLAFREGPAIIACYKKLKNKPNILLIAGHGSIHPLKAGLANYVGVSLNICSIGIAKKLLRGSEIRNNKVYVNNELRGVELKTRPYSKPIYISVGNKVSLSTAIKVVKKQLKGHKLPEPLFLANKYANKIRKKIIS